MIPFTRLGIGAIGGRRDRPNTARAIEEHAGHALTERV